eukprot:6206068-Pleurochrysis_carterae.AAC.2
MRAFGTHPRGGSHPEPRLTRCSSICALRRRCDESSPGQTEPPAAPRRSSSRAVWSTDAKSWRSGPVGLALRTYQVPPLSCVGNAVWSDRTTAWKAENGGEWRNGYGD